MTKDFNLPASLFMDVVGVIPSAVSVSGADGKIQYVNPAFEALTGYGVVDAVGKDHSFLSNNKTPARVYDDMWQTITSGKTWHGRLLNRRKDSSTYLSDLKVVPMCEGSAKPKWFLGIQNDATEALEMEQNIASQKALIENIIDVAPVVMALLNEHGKVLIDNHAYKVLMADLDGKEPAWEFMHAVSDGEPGKILLNQQEFDQVEVRIATGRLGARWFTCSGLWVDVARSDINGYYDPSPDRAFLLVGLDVTARMRAFHQAKSSALRATTAEIQQSKGMREVLHGAVYQLQGPLNMLEAVAAVLERSGSVNGPLKAAMDDVQQAGAKTIEHLRACAPSLQAEVVLPLNMNEVVREVMDLSLDRMLTEGISMSWKPTLVLPAIMGKAGQLRTLIKILLDNAIDAVNEPGARDRCIFIETHCVSGGVNIMISDTGPGIQAEDKTRLFEPFFSGWQHSVRRPGMGLAIAQSILSEHGGALEMTQADDGGCCVTMNLPVEDSSLITRGDGS